MGVPSVKTIKERLDLRKTHLGDRAATITRQAMEWAESGAGAPTLFDWVDENMDSKDFGYKDPFDAGSYLERIRRALMFIDQATEGFGVEYIPSEQDTFHSALGLEYVNQGDTYTPTVYYDHGTGVWHVGDWGTVVELHPERFR